MKIFLSGDHAGFELKNTLREYLVHHGYDVEDLGPATLDKDDDYPNYAFKTATRVLGSEDEDPRGILVCSTAQGMAIAANRIAGIRAAVAWNDEVAKLSREHEATNILSLPARFLEAETAATIAEVWLKAEFSKAPRHQRRLDEIESLYG